MAPATTLPKKLLLKPDMQARFVNTPAGFWQTFGTLPAGVALQSGGRATSDWILVFAKTRKELLRFGPDALGSLKRGGTFWAAYPKKNSGQQTDLTVHDGWEPLVDAGFENTASASIDGVWTAVRWRRAEA
jgi:hypothetical protein